jgi:hypothetical protein
MKATVNPFEPWRPVEVRIPPCLHASRPWRPPPPPPVLAAVEEPPLVELVKPHPRSKLPERPKPTQGRPGLPSERPPTSKLLWSVVIALLPVLYHAFIGLDRGLDHVPRLGWLLISAGIFAQMAFVLRLGWYQRLGGMAIALALAGISLWFVPTINGVSLCSAYRQVEELRALPAGDVAAYQGGAAARRALVEDFPAFAADVRAGEQAWLHRTVDEAIENADRQLKNDPDAALARLHQLDQDLSRLEHYASVQKDLESARRRAVQACLKVAK